MRKAKIFLLMCMTAMVFASCEVEFSPNDTWRETPVVYCLLDQDDDTTYVRVQRCFMGDGNQYRFASVADSINYPQGALTVLMEEWAKDVDDVGRESISGATPRRVFAFDYATRTGKEDGMFYNGEQPLYVCRTAGLLDSSCIYRLRVVKNATGDTIASAVTSLVSGNMSLIKPNNVTKFQFGGAGGSKTCEITWTTMAQARQYQPIVRFFYRDFIVDTTSLPWDTTITPHYIDVECNTVKSNMRDPSYTTYLDQNYFLSVIKSKVEDKTCNKNIIDTVRVFVTCCSEPLAAFLYANNPSGSIEQEPFTYTNIDGGLGVFGSRRCKIWFDVCSPGSATSNYKKTIKELGIGF